MKYKENNIQFNNVLESNFFIGGSGPLTCNKYYKKNIDGTIRHTNTDYLVNAIDIHWGGVTINNKTINSTSDLLGFIKDNIANPTTGAQGQQGQQGYTGWQGSMGNKGQQGVQGMNGVQGKQGELGQQGIRGSIGFQGQQGIVGQQGRNGNQGTTGDQGVVGMKGVQGSNGNQGIRGEQGSQGLQGRNGAQGAPGPVNEDPLTLTNEELDALLNLNNSAIIKSILSRLEALEDGGNSQPEEPEVEPDGPQGQQGSQNTLYLYTGTIQPTMNNYQGLVTEVASYETLTITPNEPATYYILVNSGTNVDAISITNFHVNLTKIDTFDNLDIYSTPYISERITVSFS